MGGRRRAQKKVASKKRAEVSKTFKCPFCSMDGAVTCKM
jgi:transcription elongation factor Elf1